MRYAWMLLLLCVIGCGGCSDKPKGENVALDQVPDPVMKVAKEKLPGITFEQAWKTPNGNFEVRGKAKSGKIHDVRVSEAGEVLEWGTDIDRYGFTGGLLAATSFLITSSARMPSASAR